MVKATLLFTILPVFISLVAAVPVPPSEKQEKIVGNKKSSSSSDSDEDWNLDITKKISQMKIKGSKAMEEEEKGIPKANWRKDPKNKKFTMAFTEKFPEDSDEEKLPKENWRKDPKNKKMMMAFTEKFPEDSDEEKIPADWRKDPKFKKITNAFSGKLPVDSDSDGEHDEFRTTDAERAQTVDEMRERFEADKARREKVRAAIEATRKLKAEKGGPKMEEE